MPAVLPPIRVSALVMLRDRRVLMVTARERDVLYLPGGKVDPGESAVDALVREAYEEVGLALDPASAAPLTTVRTQAHGEPEGRMVEMTLFTASVLPGSGGDPAPSSEVSTIHWCTSGDAYRCPPAGVATLQFLRARSLID